jgi:CRISPR-associated protein Cas1
MQFSDHTFGKVKNGVCVLSGFVVSVREENGSLVVIDGIRGSEIERRFPRAACSVSRLIATRSEGYISLAAVRQMHQTGVSFVALDYDGTPLLVSVPRSPVPAALRRAQASISIETRLGRAIVAELLRAKIAGQAATLRHFGRPAAAAGMHVYGEQITPDATAPDMLGAEGMAAVVYWQALADTPLQFGRRQNVTNHWRTFGNRRSSLTGEPRGAVTPGNAMLNYLYGVLVSEITIALHACGAAPELGVLHTDKDDRASLAYDLVESARSILDRYFFRWLAETTFSKRDFREDIFGFIRVTHPLNSHLAMTASLWRGIAEQLAAWFVQALDRGRPARLKLSDVWIETEAGRRAERWRLGKALQRPIPATCAECGKALPTRRRKFCSDDCVTAWHGGKPVAPGLAAIARARAARVARGDHLQRPASQIDAITVREWRRLSGWSIERDAKLCEWYAAILLPRLRESKIRPTDIRRAIGCSIKYSVEIKHGKKIPHPRLFRELAALVGIEYPWPVGLL